MGKGLAGWLLRSVGVAATSGLLIQTGVSTFLGSGFSKEALKRIPGLDKQEYVKAYEPLLHDIVYAGDALCHGHRRSLHCLGVLAAYFDAALQASAIADFAAVRDALLSIGSVIDTLLSETPEVMSNILPVHASTQEWKALREHHPDIDLITRFGGTIRPMMETHRRIILAFYEAAEQLLSGTVTDHMMAVTDAIADHTDAIARTVCLGPVAL